MSTLTLLQTIALALICYNCGHDRDDHDSTGRCAGTDVWYDGNRACSGPCNCLQFVQEAS